MCPEILEDLTSRFNAYTRRFYSDNGETGRAIRLKVAHTHRVRAIIVRLGQELGLGENDMLLAQTAALFHDVGRFRQYQQYGTFLDRVSENHAKLGLRVIGQEGFLNQLPLAEKRQVARAIAFHNRARLPENQNGADLFLMKLLRDADKLDIWKVVLDHYYGREAEPNRSVELGLPDVPDCSPQVVATIEKGEQVNFAEIQTLTDFKLMQLSWVFDLNFAPSFAYVRQQGYIEQMAGILPQTQAVSAMLQKAQAHVAAMLETVHP